MNKELALRTFAYLIGHYKTNNETTINQQEIEAMEFILKDNESLEQQCKKQKEVIDKAIEYISNKKAIINTDVIRIFDLFEIDEQGYTNELLDILKEVSE